MAGNVLVEREALKAGIQCCKISIHELEAASRSLQRSYQQAGAGGWKDQKYAALGGIVDECCSALTKPISDLQDCMSKLNELLQAVGGYEEVSL